MSLKKQQTREEIVSVRFTDIEISKLEVLAEEEGFRFSTWLRVLALKEMRQHKK